MGTAELTRKQWQVAHFLAGNLAYLNVSKNLVMQLREYLARQPSARPNDYLDRLVSLGDTFAGGEDELRQRKELRQIVRAVSQSSPRLDWPLVLAWTVRLMVAYRPEERGAPTPEQAMHIKERIRQELDAALAQLEKEAYYG